MTLLYIDTNIFLDIIKGRKSLSGRDLARPATKLFYRTISCEFNLALSTWTLEQIYHNLGVEEVTMTLELLKKKLVIVKYDETDKQAAAQRSKGHFEDAVHIVLAEKQKADMIITRNVDHFRAIGTTIPIKRPEHA
jgi:predicted nucleic acid-binding protein